ncbi:hypothetical protein A1Q1_04703 [Trichosporon asahii var. asahii CBS 2479]|uniref:Uncharacterized protein n=1 Tax=Trichosporon asahii var. asahii (strain ATCC 90039 / CBS 2479 / JCM 2466 / KCTC 7840 / NBRC 103889/ NCYC 2677 / UAMH 7654) TaxID=1186058 RepID=J5QD25_TRIAS|nr:hypothetical protein A1Q1_04703 [Trichosporon asahii var. asahii CBS 2479]EJT46738.1 hypothetical protein A1Q1_04703 [Trichosporon asahii var. asahii CBS 2479]
MSSHPTTSEDFTAERVRSVVAGIEPAAGKNVQVALLEDVPPIKAHIKQVVMPAQSSEGWCVALHENATPEAHVVYFAEPGSARTTPRWRCVVPDKAEAEEATKPRPASETAVRALLPRLEAAINPTSKLTWDLIALPCPPHLMAIPEAARVLLLAGWMAHSRLVVQSKLRRLDKIHYLPEWRQGIAELESGCWYGAGMRIELTPAQARKRSSRGQYRHGVNARRTQALHPAPVGYLGSSPAPSALRNVPLPRAAAIDERPRTLAAEEGDFAGGAPPPSLPAGDAGGVHPATDHDQRLARGNAVRAPVWAAVPHDPRAECEVGKGALGGEE